MKLKLNKIVYFFNWICVFVQLYSNLFNTQLYSKYQNGPKYAAYKKNIQNNYTSQAITFNHLPRHISQLGCPRQSLGHLLLVEDQSNKSFRSSSVGMIVHRHLWIAFFNWTIAFDSMPCHSQFLFLLLTLFL